MGYVERCYKRVKPTCMMLGKDDWPNLNEEIFATCKRWRETIASGDARGPKGDKYRCASESLMREYIEYRKSVPSMDVKPRACESGAVDANWPCITRSREFMSDGEKADPRANQWSKGGNWTLMVVLNFDQPGLFRD